MAVWDPTVDLAQFAISNLHIAFRRQHEEYLLRLYHETLMEQGITQDQFPFDYLFSRYKRTGIERWLQLLILMVRPISGPATLRPGSLSSSY